LDLTSGYWQIPLTEDSKPITAFSTTKGHFEFNVLPFGLSNAAAAFQRAMNEVFSKYPFVGVYLDDIIVHSSSLDDHLQHLAEVMRILHEHRFVLNKKKCRFFCEEVDYLGMRVSAKGMKPIPERLDAIKKMKIPKDKKELREFLGIVNYYREYCEGLSEVAYPLFRLTRKDVEFQWGSTEGQALEDVKHLLTNPPFLQWPDVRKPFIVSTDASKFALGAVLSQMHEGLEKPIAFASRVLSPAEENYSVVEKELLAIVFAVKKFHCYLYGTEFTVFTDHNPLQYAMTIRDTSRRIARWVLLLQEYTFHIKYRAGARNGNADVLSRFPMVGQVAVADGGRDEDFYSLQAGQNMQTESAYYEFQDKLKIDAGKLWFVDKHDKRLVVPWEKREKIMETGHGLGHFGVTKTWQLLRVMYWWPRMYNDIREHVRCCFVCQKRKNPDPSTVQGKIVTAFLPERPSQVVAWDIMGPLQASASGKRYIVVMMDLFSHWVEVATLERTDALTLARVLWKRWISRYGPPEQLHSDKGRNITAAIISHLCNTWNVKMTSTVPYHPEGNGAVERFNRTFQDIMAKRLQDSDPRRWPEYVPSAVLAHNVSMHSQTGLSPYNLMFGRRPPSSLVEPGLHADSDLQNEEFLRLKKLFEEIKSDRLDPYLKPIIKPGDLVWLFRPAVTDDCPRKFHSPWKGPMTVLQQHGRVNFLVKNQHGKELLVNSNQLKPVLQRPVEIRRADDEDCQAMGTNRSIGKADLTNGAEPPRAIRENEKKRQPREQDEEPLIGRTGAKENQPPRKLEEETIIDRGRFHERYNMRGRIFKPQKFY
jgi:hypothetical protein